MEDLEIVWLLCLHVAYVCIEYVCTCAIWYMWTEAWCHVGIFLCHCLNVLDKTGSPPESGAHWLGKTNWFSETGNQLVSTSPALALQACAPHLFFCSCLPTSDITGTCSTPVFLCPPPSTDITDTCPTPVFLCGWWGSWLRAPGLHSKHFPDRAISPAPWLLLKRWVVFQNKFQNRNSSYRWFCFTLSWNPLCLWKFLRNFGNYYSNISINACFGNRIMYW